MREQCPISGRQTDERIVRINAIIVFAAALAFIAAGGVYVMPVLAADFFIRGFCNPRFSPVANISRLLCRALRLKPEMVDAAPKIFAAKIGFVFCLAAAALYLRCRWCAAAVAAALALCAGMEAFLRICAGCKMYSLLMRFRAGQRG